jgi:hypothetical protein
MDDSQSAPDAENRKGDSARRAALRLRDAETVATSRRDMFGDGSLLDALSGAPLPRKEEQDLAADAPQAAAPEGAAEEPPSMLTADAPSPADPAAQAAAPHPAQSLDAIIDSFPVDPLSQADGQAPSDAQANPGFLAASRFALIDRGADQADPASEPVPPVFPERFQVSAIFAGLGAPESRGGEGQPADAASPDGAEAEGAAAPRPDGAVPSLGAFLVYQPSIEVSLPEPSNWPPAEATDAPRSETDKPLIAAAEPSPPEASAESASSEQVAPAGIEPPPEPLGWPPFPEPPGTHTDADVPPLEPPSLVTSPESVTGPAGMPFPAPPAWPPFMEPPGSDADHSGAAPSGLPPYFELPAHPEQADGEVTTPSGVAAFTEPLPGAGPDDDATTGLSDTGEAPRFQSLDDGEPPFDSAARASAAASAKIAAEANATAQALDNLQRLLSKTVAPAAPAVQPQSVRPQAPPPRARNAHLHLPPKEPAPFVHELAPMLPLPMTPPERAGGNNVYLLGFLTGLVLSMMAGAALYFLINAGG